MKKCITYQTEPKHVVIMNARNAATAFYPFRRWKKSHARTARRRWIMKSDLANLWRMCWTPQCCCKKIEGEEEVEKMDALLSLAITGGDFDWI